jgi:hypothetical protein
MKTLKNVNFEDCKRYVDDVKSKGDPDTWKLMCKAWSEKEGWMKSSKAMEISEVGCLVQVTTQQDQIVSEAVTFVPGVKLATNEDGTVKLVKI